MTKEELCALQNSVAPMMYQKRTAMEKNKKHVRRTNHLMVSVINIGKDDCIIKNKDTCKQVTKIK